MVNAAVSHVIGSRFTPWSYMFQSGKLMRIHADLAEYHRIIIFISDDPEYTEFTNISLMQLGARLRMRGLPMPQLFAYNVNDAADWFWEGIWMIFEVYYIKVDLLITMDVCNYRLPTKLPVNVYFSSSVKNYWHIDKLQASNISTNHGTIVRMDAAKIEWASELATCSIAIICIYKFTPQITDILTHISTAAKKYPIKFILIKASRLRISGGYYGLALRLLNNPIVLDAHGDFNLLTSAVCKMTAEFNQ